MIEGNPCFETTQWSIVLAAGGDSSRADQALSELCRTYWYPLYAFIRRWGHDPDDAADLTQSFLLDLFVRDTLKGVDPTKGRFRSFLLACCRNFLCKDRRRQSVRGPSPVTIDAGDAERRYGVEPADSLTPEQLYDRQWALAVLGRALDTLRGEYARGGKAEVFGRLEPVLAGEPPAGGYAVAAEALGMSEGAAHVAAHRLRRRYREAIRGVIAGTVDDPGEIEEELHDLFAALARPAPLTSP